MTSELRVPDVVGEIVGWRAWKIIGSEREPRLFSVTNSTLWVPGEWIEAVCSRGHTSEQIPHEGCACGIYAARTREHLLEMSYNRYGDDDTVVIGEVGFAGKVIPGTQGWRAQKARPLRLFVPYERWRFVERLAGDYGVPVELSNTFKAVA